MKKVFSILLAVGILFNLSGCGKSDTSTPKNLHNNCMFIGYADPNRKLDGSTIVSMEPKYGYRPVYVDRADIYNTYHFH